MYQTNKKKLRIIMCYYYKLKTEENKLLNVVSEILRKIYRPDAVLGRNLF